MEDNNRRALRRSQLRPKLHPQYFHLRAHVSGAFVLRPRHISYLEDRDIQAHLNRVSPGVEYML
jgi:hypothetical protein